MKGISSTIQEQIDKVLDRFFNQMARQLLGYLPNQGDKSVMISVVPEDSLIHLFVESIGGRKPVPQEEEVLKNLLLTASNYVESLKSKTKADVLNSLTSAVTDARLKQKEASVTDLGEILKEKMGKAQSHFKLISEAEATKFRNTGRFLNIKKTSTSDDPTIVFQTMKDNLTCLEENELIQTKNGLLKVGDVKVGDLLYSPSQKRASGCRVTSVEKKQEKVLELDFGESKIVCTFDHPILVRTRRKDGAYIYFFAEAQKINESHDVVLFKNDLSKGEKAKITRADTVKLFMSNLGYDSCWDFWRENLDGMLKTIENTQRPSDLQKKYGISVDMWNSYVRPILLFYKPDLTTKTGVPDNKFNKEYLKKKKQFYFESYYDALGGDEGFKKLILDGKNSYQVSKQFGIPLAFLRKKTKELNLTSFLKRKAALVNWDKNREKLAAISKARGTLHFKTVSKPELVIYQYLKEHFPSIQNGFAIGNMKVDFCIPDQKCVIEYDGSGHDLRDRLKKNVGTPITDQTDYRRDLRLKNLGFRILRLKVPQDHFELSAIKETVLQFLSSKKEFEVWRF